MTVLLEVCAGSYQDCLEAYRAGAKRVELNSSLSLGGLTPSIGTLKKVRENTDLQVICMIRPRGAGFLYSKEEYEVMKEDARILLENGADGLAFGFLQGNYDIDKLRTKEFVEIIHSYGKKAVFHRAFDLTRNAELSIEALIECGVDRVLTSGQRESAQEGRFLIKQWIEKYGKAIEILPGCGININNACEILSVTGANQVHSSCKGYRKDITTKNEYIDFSYLIGEQNISYECVESEIVKQMLEIIGGSC